MEAIRTERLKLKEKLFSKKKFSIVFYDVVRYSFEVRRSVNNRINLSVAPFVFNSKTSQTNSCRRLELINYFVLYQTRVSESGFIVLMYPRVGSNVVFQNRFYLDFTRRGSA